MPLRSLSKAALLALLLLPAALLFLGCPTEVDSALISSRSYSGHESDQDANNFVRAYPSALDTRLDDCQMCHSGGQVVDDKAATVTISNACNWCHLIQWPNSKYVSGYPVSYADTLNPYGQDYESAGRDPAALEWIRHLDSDDDGYSNQLEIFGDRFPGSSASKPGQVLAPYKEFTLGQIAAMPAHPQFLLMNTNKQQYDDYVHYNGPTVEELLSQAGVDLDDPNITSITAIAPDGFETQFDILAVRNEDGAGGTYYPDSIFYDVDQSNMSTEQRFVIYPQPLPTNQATLLPYAANDAIQNLWLTIAYQRNDGTAFGDLNSAYYDSVSGKLEGEGPFRIIPPQSDPGRPDRGAGRPLVGDGWDYSGALDHNAGSSVRGMCILRVNPMPAGFEAYDTSNGWSLIDEKKIVIYGYGIED